MFELIKVIEKEECYKIYNEIKKLECFISKSSNIGIATLGAASYLHGNEYISSNKDIDFKNTAGFDMDYVEEQVSFEDADEIYSPLHIIDYDNKKKNIIKNQNPDLISNDNDCEWYYDKLKNITNPILMKSFANLYNKICTIINNRLNEPCVINDDANLAFPGFNIYTPYENCEKIDGPPHIDLQWSYHINNLKQRFDNVSEKKFLTFTLSIKLPKSGAGLYIWPLEEEKISTYKSAKKYYKEIIIKSKSLFTESKFIDKNIFEKETNAKFITYEEGYMTFFDNLLLHQVAPFNIPYENLEERITLQGHGIKCDNVWRLFF